MRAIAEKDYSWTPPTAGAPRRPPRLSRQAIGHCLSNAGFEVEQVEEFTYEQSAESIRAWLSVPIFTEHHLPGGGVAKLSIDEKILRMYEDFRLLAREAGVTLPR